MTAHQDRLEQALDALDDAARRRLAAWQALRLSEDQPIRERELGGAGLEVIEDLLELGWLERGKSRSLLPWRRGVVFQLTASGEAQLHARRKELKRLQALIRGALETGWGLLELEGVNPAEFHFERMLLVFGRFADQPVGFPEAGARLARLVRDVEREAGIQAEDGVLSTAAAVGLITKLDQ